MTVSVSVLSPGLAEGFTGYAAETFADAPALSRFAASQVLGLPAPDDILAQGLDPASLLPARLLQKA